MAFDLGSAVVDIRGNNKPLFRTLSIARGGFTKFGSIAGSAIREGVAAAIPAGLGLLKLGSDAQEAGSKFQAVWGPSADTMRNFADEFATAVGRSKQEMRGFVASLGDLFQPLGFSNKQAQELTKNVTRLGVDLASFNNEHDSEAIERLNSGLLGSHEVLKQYGIVINDAILKQELANMGFKNGTEGVTEQAKVLARLAIVQRSTTAAQGDAAKTSGGYANTLKGTLGALQDLGAEMGQALLPIATEMLNSFRGLMGTGDGFAQTFANVVGPALGFVAQGFVDLISWIKTTIEFVGVFGSEMTASVKSSGGALSGFGSVVGKVFGGIMKWIKDAAFVVINWDLTLQTLWLSIKQGFGDAVNVVKAAFTNMVNLGKWLIDNWLNIFKTYFSFMTSLYTNLGKNTAAFFKALWSAAKGEGFNFEFTPLLDGFENTIKEMPKIVKAQSADYKKEWADLDDEWFKRTRKWEEIGKKNEVGEKVKKAVETDFSQKLDLPNIDAKQFKATSLGKKDKKSSAGQFKDLTSAWRDAQSSLLKQEKKVPEQQLKVAKDANKKLDKVVEVLEKNQKQLVLG